MTIRPGALGLAWQVCRHHRTQGFPPPRTFSYLQRAPHHAHVPRMYPSCFDVGRIVVAMADHVDSGMAGVLSCRLNCALAFCVSTRTVKENDCMPLPASSCGVSYALDVRGSSFQSHASEICPNAQLAPTPCRLFFPTCCTPMGAVRAIEYDPKRPSIGTRF